MIRLFRAGRQIGNCWATKYRIGRKKSDQTHCAGLASRSLLLLPGFGSLKSFVGKGFRLLGLEFPFILWATSSSSSGSSASFTFERLAATVVPFVRASEFARVSGSLKGGISSSLTGVTEPEPRLDFTDLPLSLLAKEPAPLLSLLPRLLGVGVLLPEEMAAPTGVETVDNCDCWECRDGDLCVAGRLAASDPAWSSAAWRGL